jgi:ubiquinone/menaquinone biosynthesis C-methylase UbiE
MIRDHYGGITAVDRLMANANVVADDLVLDICSGMGGPARYIASKAGCQVVGLDLTASRVEGATALTEAARLSDKVEFVHGIALGVPFEDQTFTSRSVKRHSRTYPTSAS